MMNTRVGRARVAVVLAALVTFLSPVQGQEVRTGAPVSPAHRRLHERGAEFIISQQADGGSWESSAGVSGICIMALLASGQDPNHGKYADSIRRGLRSLIAQQSRSSGQIGSGMYEHGFAMLCLADCFGALDERLFEDKDLELERSIGDARRAYRLGKFLGNVRDFRDEVRENEGAGKRGRARWLTAAAACGESAREWKEGEARSM